MVGRLEVPLTGVGKCGFEGKSGAQVWILSQKCPLTAPQSTPALRKHIRQRLGAGVVSLEAPQAFSAEKFPFILSGNAY